MPSETAQDVEVVCVLVGKTSNAFSVRVISTATVETLKQAILQGQPNQLRGVDSSQLSLFLAKKIQTSSWLEEKDVETLVSIAEYPIKLFAQAKLAASGLSITEIGDRDEVAVAEGKGAVHVLVTIAKAGEVVRRSQAVDARKAAFARQISSISSSADPNIVFRFMGLDDDDMLNLAKAMVDRGTVEVLDLQSNKIGDLGAGAVASILTQSKVKQLVLANNKIGEGGVESLTKRLDRNTPLILDLHRNPIGNAGAKFIAKALENLEVLTELDLGTAEIHGDGAIALADALITNKTLKKLNLMGNDIEKAGVKKLAKALKTNKTLESLVLSKHHVLFWYRWFVLDKDKIKYEQW